MLTSGFTLDEPTLFAGCIHRTIKLVLRIEDDDDSGVVDDDDVALSLEILSRLVSCLPDSRPVSYLLLLVCFPLVDSFDALIS